MSVHYSQPKGFVGRNICYAIYFDDTLYGHIVGGSSTFHLKSRDDYFGIPSLKLSKIARQWMLRRIVNNIFFHIEPVGGRYPLRNFSKKVISIWRKQQSLDWKNKYGESVIGFETLVELPRIGECYKRDGWIQVGQTEGWTCKRTSGQGTDSWSGKRIWNTDKNSLRPKRIFCIINTLISECE